MAIRDQRIDIGYGVQKLWRIVYDYRSDPRQRLQTGFVQYDNNCIPVWRPYDPEDPGLDASWRAGVWSNIHSLAMPNDPTSQKRRYMMTEHHIGQDGEVLLPMVEVQLTFALREYLEEVRALRQLTAAHHPQ